MVIDLPPDLDNEKRLAAEAAAGLVEDGMMVGLGTGSTVAHLLPAARGAQTRDPVRRHVGRDRAPRPRARPRRRAVRGHRAARHRDRRRRPDRARRLAGQGRRRRPHPREDRRRGRRPLRRDRRLVEAGRRALRPDPARAAPLRARRDAPRARRRGAPRGLAAPSPDDGLIADYTGEVGDPILLAARLSATPGVVDHGLFPPGLVADVIVGRGESVERARLAV